MIFFVILDPFGILTHYHIIDCSIGLENTFNGSYIKFSEISLWFRHFLALFYLFFWILPVFFVVLVVNDFL